MEITREQILRHKDQIIPLLLNEVTVKSHQRRSKKGKISTVRQYNRDQQDAIQSAFSGSGYSTKSAVGKAVANYLVGKTSLQKLERAFPKDIDSEMMIELKASYRSDLRDIKASRIGHRGDKAYRRQVYSMKKAGFLVPS